MITRREVWWDSHRRLWTVRLWRDGEHFSLNVYAAEVAALASLRPWNKVADATFPHDTWIEVAGDSGYTSCKWFTTIAKYDPEYRPLDPWGDVQNNRLSDCGWVPLLWRPVAMPGEST